MANRVKLPAGFFQKGQTGAWKSELSPVEKYIFHKTAGDLLIELGYADESWWKEQGIRQYWVPVSSMFYNGNNPTIKFKRRLKKLLYPA